MTPIDVDHATLRGEEVTICGKFHLRGLGG
jgi:hypothetical protein